MVRPLENIKPNKKYHYNTHYVRNHIDIQNTYTHTVYGFFLIFAPINIHGSIIKCNWYAFSYTRIHLLIHNRILIPNCTKFLYTLFASNEFCIHPRLYIVQHTHKVESYNVLCWLYIANFFCILFMFLKFARAS